MAELPTEQQSVGDSPAQTGSIPLVASAGAMGGDIGSALESAAEVSNRLHHDAVQQFNQVQVLDANNQLHDHVQATVFDPGAGLLSRNLGKDAPAAVDNNLVEFDDKVAKISGGLANDQQRDQFQRHAEEQRYALQAHLNAYESKQLNAYREQTVTATLQNEQRGAVESYGLPPDPATGDHLQKHLENIKAVLTDNAAAEGVPDMVRDQQIFQATSSTYAAVADDALTNGNVGYVKQLLKEHGSEIDPKQRDLLTKAMQTTDLTQRSLDTATKLYTDKNGNARSLSDQLDDAEKITDAPLHDHVVQRIMQHHAEQRAANTDLQQTISNDWFKKIDLDAGANDADNLITPVDRAKLDPQLVRSALNYSALLKKHDLPPDTSERYIELKAAVGTPEFAALNVNAERDRLSPGDFKEITNAWIAQRGGNAKKSPEYTGIMSEKLATDNFLAQLKLPPIGSDRNVAPEDAVTQMKFAKAFSEAVAMEKQANGGKPLGDDDFQKIGDRLIAAPNVAHPGIMGFFAGPDTPGTPSKTNAAFLNPEFDYRRSYIEPQGGARVSEQGIKQWLDARKAYPPGTPEFATNARKLAGWRDSPDPALRLRYQQVRAALEADAGHAPPGAPRSTIAAPPSQPAPVVPVATPPAKQRGPDVVPEAARDIEER